MYWSHKPPCKDSLLQKCMNMAFETGSNSQANLQHRLIRQEAVVSTAQRIFGRADSFNAVPLGYGKFDSHTTTSTTESEAPKPLGSAEIQLKKRPPESILPEDFLQYKAPAASHSEALDNPILVKEEDLTSLDEESEDCSSAPHVSEEVIQLSQLASQIVEENRLSVNKSKHELGDFEKLLISNLVYIINKSRVSTCLERDEFAKAVNSALCRRGQKRKDAQLRFVYKRAIKILMSKVTGYIANKTYHMEAFAEDFVRYYFPALPKAEDYCSAGSKEEVMDTSFASKRKILRLFALSPVFKKDFLDYALPELRSRYTKYISTTYCKMIKCLKAANRGSLGKAQVSLNKPVKAADRPEGPEAKKVEKNDILFKRFKRVPWSAAELEVSIQMVRNLVK